ncbi:helix-turn-helix transcriptional regulator [Lusitaniella coriacea LEGE 07157]|uniref:Helix-turn-helix transcriptional regulator n=1 Tax=Lusitaniella coriacea LEGE 07157 TaxID=945747 RepID=A0A8J7IUA2_9CYAN|nr:helix-turn-helix transcriptional regulator [Lusitaniella coriacea]MBE9116383.1 helix-turn-helix transcriptional regulator [Lusitaniella coriacea LEGE 07157]
MGKASQALKTVLEAYGISQNKLAVTLGIDRAAVFKWFHKQREPTSETIVAIVKALKKIDRAAAKEFVQRYLGEILDEED